MIVAKKLSAAALYTIARAGRATARGLYRPSSSRSSPGGALAWQPRSVWRTSPGPGRRCVSAMARASIASEARRPRPSRGRRRGGLRGRHIAIVRFLHTLAGRNGCRDTTLWRGSQDRPAGGSSLEGRLRRRSAPDRCRPCGECPGRTGSHGAARGLTRQVVRSQGAVEAEPSLAAV